MKTYRKTFQNNNRVPGLTLLELVTAITILGIAIPPILGFFAESNNKRLLVERQTIAYFLAMEKMETILADRHSPNRGYSFLTGSNYPQETMDNGYIRSVEFQEVSPTDLSTAQENSGYLKITVTVSYSNPDGDYSLYYLVCNLS